MIHIFFSVFSSAPKWVIYFVLTIKSPKKKNQNKTQDCLLKEAQKCWSNPRTGLCGGQSGVLSVRSGAPPRCNEVSETLRWTQLHTFRGYSALLVHSGCSCNASQVWITCAFVTVEICKAVLSDMIAISYLWLNLNYLQLYKFHSTFPGHTRYM